MRARIANSGMDFWAMLAAVALATLLLVAATQLQAQTYSVPHNFSRSDCAMPVPSASPHSDGNLCSVPAQGGGIESGCSARCGTAFEKTPNGSALVVFTSAVGRETAGDSVP
jgi:hypothetical protein